jgi:serine/threonine-protein kinase
VDEDRFIGREIAGYRIEELLGRGGMGIVYRAEHVRLGRRVAFKVVAPEISNDPRFRERFLRESRTAGSIDHPNVVPIYDAGEADGVLYMAMRLVDGTDLASLIEREGRLEPARVGSLIAQIAAALDTAHEAGLVHRDVKPSNVLIPSGGGRREHAYLGDFGLTKRLTSQSGVTASAAFLGTIAYVAPEQIEGRPIDARADQYSLACVAYECLTGHRPFEKEGDIAVLWAHMQDPFPSLALHGVTELAATVDPIIQRAAAKAPDERYPSCGDFAADLEAALPSLAGQSPTPTSPISVPTPPVVAKSGGKRSAAGRRRGLVAVVSLLGFAVVGVLAWRLLASGPAGPLLSGSGLLRINAATNVVGSPVELDTDPTAVVAGPEGAWVLLTNSSQVVLISNSGDITPVNVGERPAGLARSEELVFVSSAADRNLTPIEINDPTRVPKTQALGFRPGIIAVGGELLWLVDTGDDLVWHVGLDGKGLGSIGTGGGPSQVAATTELVWVSNAVDETLTRISAAAFLSDPPVDLDFGPGALAVLGDDLWILNPTGDELVRYNVRTRSIEARIPVGSHPVAVFPTADAVWVANGADGTVSRVDPTTEEVISISVGGSPTGIAVSEGTVWVAIGAD